jgi:hypothetical protein
MTAFIEQTTPQIEGGWLIIDLVQQFTLVAYPWTVNIHTPNGNGTLAAPSQHIFGPIFCAHSVRIVPESLTISYVGAVLEQVSITKSPYPVDFAM